MALTTGSCPFQLQDSQFRIYILTAHTVPTRDILCKVELTKFAVIDVIYRSLDSCLYTVFVVDVGSCIRY